jgi:predicted heme/steroid binding protein
MREFTLAELGGYNGQHGAPAYVAYHGHVYDVTGSYFFRNGRHWIIHRAGTDLSAEIAAAPHDSSFLHKFPVVGSLKTG